MPLSISKKAISLAACLSFVLPAVTGTASPAAAAGKAKAKPKAAVKSKAPIVTHHESNEQPLDLEGVRENLEGRLNTAWQPMSIGKTMYCEVHFLLWSDGHFSDVSIWRSSGDKHYDSAAKLCIEGGNYAPFLGVDNLETVATFKTEAMGADVVVRFPKYQGATSKVDRHIAAVRAQKINTIKLMLERIKAAQKVLGSDSPKLSESINFLGNTYAEVEDYSSAEAAFKWAIAIREKSNGPNSKELAESLSDLGEMYRVRGDYVTAETYFKRVVNMKDMKPSVQLRNAIHRYAKLCLATKRKEDADYLFKMVEDMQSGKTIDPLPANLVLEPAAAAAADSKDKETSAAPKGDEGKPQDTKDGAKDGAKAGSTTTGTPAAAGTGATGGGDAKAPAKAESAGKTETK